MTSEAQAARGRIEWTRRRMPLLSSVGRQFSQTRPFEGLRIAFRLHVEPKTAVLLEALQAGGAEVEVLGNQGTTQFGTAEVLRSSGLAVLDEPGDDARTTATKVGHLASSNPDLVLDNGAEVIAAVIEAGSALRGATEETTSGAFLLREEYDARVPFPVVVINDSPLKSLVENKHGVGESVIDTVTRVTNLALHRLRVIVFGYGWCGRGIALYAARRGAAVEIVEPDELKALEATMDGFRVVEGADLGAAQLVFTATGRDDVIATEQLTSLSDGAILANAGHTDREIDVGGFRSLGPVERLAPSIERVRTGDGRELFLLAEGRIINLAAQGGLGNPIQAMDMGLTLQARSLEALALGRVSPLGPQPVPDAVDREVARAFRRTLERGESA
ncbi:MAG: adenosylhomocysteinase [Acidobacteriota bacterium]